MISLEEMQARDENKRKAIDRIVIYKQKEGYLKGYRIFFGNEEKYIPDLKRLLAELSILLYEEV